ncbi:MAG: hypothetical protein ACXADU_10865 [Promethearchaeota archaeon]|jgi:hypothetical protein
MGYIMVFTWFPSDKWPEVAAVGQKAAERFPADESLGTVIVPLAVGSGKDGVEAQHIFLPKEGKFEEAWARYRRGMAMYNDIEGFSFQLRHWVTQEEIAADVAASQ